MYSIFSTISSYGYIIWALSILLVYGAVVTQHRVNERALNLVYIKDFNSTSPEISDNSVLAYKQKNLKKNKSVPLKIKSGLADNRENPISENREAYALSSEQGGSLSPSNNLVLHKVDWGLIASFFTIFLFIVLRKDSLFEDVKWLALANNEYTGLPLYDLNPLAVFLSVTLVILNIVCFITSKTYFSSSVVAYEVICIWLLSILGGLLVIGSTDLISLYLSLELQSFCFVVLCLIKSESPYCIEAAMKYFLLSALASLILLIGSFYIYNSVGTTNLLLTTELVTGATGGDGAESLKDNIFLKIGVWTLAVGLLWKLAAAPMHFWAADVYTGAPTPVSLVLSTSPKLAILGFWIIAASYLANTVFSGVFFFFSAASMVAGALGALGQIHIKRLIAYSSINHTGLALIPLVGGISFSLTSTIALVHVIYYFITSIAVWTLCMWPLLHTPEE